MHEVFIGGESAVTSLGFNLDEQVQNLKNDITGVKKVTDRRLATEDFFASLMDEKKAEELFSQIGNPSDYTCFEKLCILSADIALRSNQKIKADSGRTLFILSTTKGNIDLLEAGKKLLFDPERIYLWRSAEVIARFFGNKNTPVVISNACISGVLAMINAYDMLSSGEYENAVVIGGDLASEFIVSGFQSFKSLSFGPCKPFDINRDGLNLGEGSGTIILTNNKENIPTGDSIKILGGASANDANHISGPSRTGEGLYFAVTKAMQQASINAGQVDFISAHGTATPFNDEMEAKAFALAGLSKVPINSLKSYFGHTLGAAGIIESVFAIEGMKQGVIFNTLGFSEYGVPDKVTINNKLTQKEQKFIIKTASGFGGCNAAVVFAK
jgi:3-oxoacyl-[acyl-carrier-protein] synthase-1